MTVPVMMWIACFLAATEAGPCIDNHHCSDCDNTTGHCLTECDTGYYDQYCSSNCSKSCKNKTCIHSTNGSGNCTEGCVPGYQGSSCNIPCDSPGGDCTACPGGCDGGYCQLNSSCVSGCVDSYYGTDCDGKSGGTVGLSVGLSTSAVVVMVMICLVVCCKYRQRSRKRSVTQTEDVVSNNTTEMVDAPVSELEWYSDMPQTDMAVQSESPDGNCGGPVEAGGVEEDVYDVADGGKREFDAADCNIYSKLAHARVTQTEDVVCNNDTTMDDASVSELEWYSDMPQTDMAVQSESPDENCGGPVEAGGVEDDVYDVADGGKREFDAVDCNIYSNLSHAWTAQRMLFRDLVSRQSMSLYTESPQSSVERKRSAKQKPV